jgi:hypothetical protein
MPRLPTPHAQDRDHRRACFAAAAVRDTTWLWLGRKTVSAHSQRKNRRQSPGNRRAKVARSRQNSAVRLPSATNPVSSSSCVLYYSHSSDKQPALYFNLAYVRSRECVEPSEATSHNPPDSDLKPASIRIKIRPPLRFEASHDSNQLPAGFRL